MGARRSFAPAIGARLDQLPLATEIPARLPALDGFTFEGYRNPDGTVGTRNLLGIRPPCSPLGRTLEFAVRRIKSEILPKYPNVDDMVGSPTFTVAALPSTPPTARSRSARSAISAAIPISVGKRWW